MKFAGQSSQFSPRKYNTEFNISEAEHKGVPSAYASQTKDLRSYKTNGPRHRRKVKSDARLARTISTRVSLMTLLFVVVLFFNGTVAQERVHPALQKAARKELLFNRRPAPDSPHRRALIGRAAIPTTAAATSNPATSTTGIATAPGTDKGTLPQPFDTTLGNNFTSTACPAYFTKFLADPVFQACYPFSLLLQTSHAFFEAEKNYVKTTIALDASCNANFAKCNTLMQSIAYKIKQPEVCGTDYTSQNPLVLQATNGLLAYASMYQAGCLKDPAGSYCFANAITGTNSSLADVYPYWLPLGTEMPSGVRATCTTCLKNTMGIFRVAASNSTLPISKTYVAAAQLINIGCGPDYVSDSIDFRTSSAARTFSLSMTPAVTILVMLIAILR